ncbi:MAG: DUF1282 family protein [Candidatus Margulisbacteria bacterium]|nr:DUF1282 family protein [Candidatus Margulisiibacteriota bacterium]
MNIVERAKNILTRPAMSFEEIKGEQSTIKDLFLRYAMILAAIPALANFIGLTFIGNQFIRVSIGSSLIISLISYLIGLAGIYIIAFFVNVLSPKFQGKKDMLAAVKLLVYSATAMWLAGIFGIVPQISILSLLGLYSVYLLYVGIPVLLDIPKEKTLLFTVVVIALMMLVMIILNGLISPITFSLISPM